jgi:DNA-binding CsgD family transcriptional regulator
MALLSPKFLTKRQQEILALFALGKTTKEIASELKAKDGTPLSEKTVEYHRMQVMMKLRLFSIPQLTHYALAVGLVENLYKDETIVMPIAKNDTTVNSVSPAPAVHIQEPTPEEKVAVEKIRRTELVIKKAATLRVASINRTAGIIGKWRTARRPANVNDKYGDTFAIHDSRREAA